MAGAEPTEITILDNFLIRIEKSCISYTRELKKENKKQAQKRIAKEKMYASWKSVNYKTPTVHHIKQVCKPHHRLKSF